MIRDLNNLLPGTIIQSVEIKQRLGCGTNGYAYLTTENQVLKITFSEQEYLSAIAFMRDDYPYLKKCHCDIYKAWIERDNENLFYCILKEFIPNGLNFDEFNDWVTRCFKNPSRHLMNDFTILENVGKRNNGEIVCFDGMINIK